MKWVQSTHPSTVAVNIKGMIYEERSAHKEGSIPSHSALATFAGEWLSEGWIGLIQERGFGGQTEVFRQKAQSNPFQFSSRRNILKARALLKEQSRLEE